jgi:hypothetical protein
MSLEKPHIAIRSASRQIAVFAALEDERGDDQGNDEETE